MTKRQPKTEPIPEPQIVNIRINLGTLQELVSLARSISAAFPTQPPEERENDGL
jgi:hypothetical protein